ncbi:Concanavalin A-like lectin/glucanase, subgroup [Artemisia annua]|uniref:Concanavalin A-like lectin/glucanase, subgroup n=1 Tax=Artemisia annua TaxID=35608 RepID=A0A2U1N5I0_ARTAN|nr:Concanavalin A-like lectin/glucanase, subgroup [Artemisia annua]
MCFSYKPKFCSKKVIYTEMVIVLEIWVLISVLLYSLQTQVLVISQNLICDANDLTGLTGFMNGLESPIDGWLFTNSSSLESSSCCNWIGITCNISLGRIVRLELPNKRLSGNLSDSVSYLDHLRAFNLSNNFLKGPLPVSLFHLTYLEEVDLSSNEFDEVLPVTVNLPALQVLDVSDNNLRGSLQIGLCANSTRIRVLSFGGNYFTGSIPLQFEACNFLEHLSAASNYISGVIPDFLLTLPRLRELALENNEFTAFANRISNVSSGLVRLDVSSNRISGNLPDFFYMFPNIHYFSAHSNNLSGTIPPSLSNSQNISYLNLRNNSFDGSINLNCSMMVNLTSLNLGSNNFSGTLPANLATCRNLKAINVAKNNLIGQIPESFKNLQSLSYFSISNCSFSNLSTSLKILQHCPNLTVLVFTMNFYTERLPSDHSNLLFKSLKALVIANCRLTGSIPYWLNGLTQLQLLDLSWNDLTGMVPAYIGDFKFLFYLDLSSNSLSGEMPKSLTRLQSLISTDISLEEPSPDFSFFIWRNTSAGSGLQYNQIMSFPPKLDLSGNHLTGPIWPEFGNLKKLHSLYLGHNNLSGSIPSSLSGMRNIEILDFSYNSLTGTIPPTLVRLSFLSRFSVAYNNLTGIIPSGGQFWTFPNSSFEGNPGLCGVFFNNCEKNQLLKPQLPSEMNDEFPILRLLVIIGFGTGFLLAVLSLIVVPGIRGARKQNG